MVGERPSILADSWRANHQPSPSERTVGFSHSGGLCFLTSLCSVIEYSSADFRNGALPGPPRRQLSADTGVWLTFPARILHLRAHLSDKQPPCGVGSMSRPYSYTDYCVERRMESRSNSMGVREGVARGG